MPELPEVEIVRQSLDKKIKQKKVKKVIVRNRNLRTKIPLNFPRFLEGKKIIKSKKIFKISDYLPVKSKLLSFTSGYVRNYSSNL